MFVEKIYLEIMNTRGEFGLILPHKLINADFGVGLRRMITENQALDKIIHFGTEQVFEGARTYTCLLFLNKIRNKHFEFYEINDLSQFKAMNSIKDKTLSVSLNQPDNTEWHFSSSGNHLVIDKMKAKSNLSLGEVSNKIFAGVDSGLDGIFLLEYLSSDADYHNCFSKKINAEIQIEKGVSRFCYMGKDVKRYENPTPKHVIIYPHVLDGDKTNPINEKTLEEKFPKTYSYLSQFKEELIPLKIRKKTNPKFWYSLHRARQLIDLESSHIKTPEISNRCNMTIVEDTIFFNTKVYAISFQSDLQENILYFLGLLNSNLLWLFLKSTGDVLSGGYYTFKTNYLSPFPVKLIEFSKDLEKQQHDKVVTLTQNMLNLNKEKATTNNPKDLKEIEREIAQTDRKINNIFYDLYELTDEEIAIVEDSLSN